MGDISSEAQSDSAATASMEAMVKPVRPDPGEVREQTRKLSAAIERYATRIQEIKDQTGDRKGHRSEPSAEERALSKTLQDTRSSFQAAMRQKQAIRDALNKSNQARESLRIKVRQIKENTKISSIEEIDSQIKRLEEKVNKDDITEAEEQDCIAKIRQLVRSRETVRSLRKQLDAMQSDETSYEDMTDRLKDVDSELDKYKQREKEVSRELEVLKRQREEQESVYAELMAEKKECWQVLCALREKKKELNDAFTDRMSQYRQQNQEYHVKRKQLQKQQYHTCHVTSHYGRRRAAEERAKEEKERTERVNERPPEPPKKAVREKPAPAPGPSVQQEAAWQKEREKKRAERRQREQEWKQNLIQEKVAACVYLLSYLAQFQRSAKDETECSSEAAGSVSVSWSPSEAGMKQLKKAENEDKDAWLMGNKAKKNKHRKPKKPSKTEKPEDKILMHSLQIFQSFSDLKVAPPDTLADVPKAIQMLEDLKMRYETGNIDSEPKTTANEVPEASRSEQTKNQLPVTLEDLDPLESPDPEDVSEFRVQCLMTVRSETEIHLELHIV